jgi:hypothetical protein
VFHTQAATFPSRSVKLSDNLVSATAQYEFSFIVTTAGQHVNSIRFQFCSNTPLIGDTCVAPVGFDASGATIASQSGNVGFSIDTVDSTGNVIVLTRPPTVASVGMSTVEFSGIVNPSSSGSYYSRVETFGSADATGTHMDYGGLAYNVVDAGVSISTYVPPFLLFCNGITITGFDCSTATGDYVDFGELSTTQARTGSTQFLVATNAGDGYTVSMDGTTMTSGSNVINALSSSDVSRPGTSQFGVNLRKNTDPSIGQNVSGPGAATVTTNYNTPNRYRFISGEPIVSSVSSSDYRKFTVSYVVNVPHGQTPGIYVSSMTFDCLASF